MCHSSHHYWSLLLKNLICPSPPLTCPTLLHMQTRPGGACVDRLVDLLVALPMDPLRNEQSLPPPPTGLWITTRLETQKKKEPYSGLRRQYPFKCTTWPWNGFSKHVHSKQYPSITAFLRVLNTICFVGPPTAMPSPPPPPPFEHWTELGLTELHSPGSRGWGDIKCQCEWG